MIKLSIVILYALSILFVHFRGKARLPFFRQVFDHSSVVSPVNIFMYMFSKVAVNKPYLSFEDFKSLEIINRNWEMIRDEALNLESLEKIKAANKNDDAGFNSFFKTGWKRFYLKWYDANHPSAIQFCPKTVALLRQIPEVKAAMFAELPPNAKLNPHRDPFAGSIRYHLGLSTPNDDRCFIEVNKERYSWRDGEAVLFDETYIHWAFNGTDKNRIILFCDVERPMKFKWAQSINRWFGHVVMTTASSPNETGDETGGINKIFRFFWAAGKYRRKLKQFSKPLYYLIKICLIIGLGLLIYFI